jgi:hypothetical protein
MDARVDPRIGELIGPCGSWTRPEEVHRMVVGRHELKRYAG